MSRFGNRRAAGLRTGSGWPALPLDEWEPTYRTLHRWSQIVGKVRLELCSPENHWWHTSLRFNARGLTTTLMPYGERQFEIAFDFISHVLRISTTDGEERQLPLESRSVADFYRAVLSELRSMKLDVKIYPIPAEIPNPISFEKDTANATYDREQVARMWTILANIYEVFSRFRGRFIGKSSPVHFFWGAFDVALTRFSGRPNPSPPADKIMREGYSHEVISHGFWFGGDWPIGGRIKAPIFYAYAVPEPSGFREAHALPTQARYASEFGEFILPYDDVRIAKDPAAEVLSFMQSTYDAGATLAQWDRASLERRNG